MRNSTVERQPGVITVVNAVVRIMGVRCSGADPDVTAERPPSVGTEGAPDLGIGIGDAISVTREDAVIAESGWTQAVRIDIHKDPASTLGALRQSADLHYLAIRTDGNVAVGAIVRAGDDLRPDEAAHLAQTGHRRTGGYDG